MGLGGAVRGPGSFVIGVLTGVIFFLVAIAVGDPIGAEVPLSRDVPIRFAAAWMWTPADSTVSFVPFQRPTRRPALARLAEGSIGLKDMHGVLVERFEGARFVEVHGPPAAEVPPRAPRGGVLRIAGAIILPDVVDTERGFDAPPWKAAVVVAVLLALGALTRRLLRGRVSAGPYIAGIVAGVGGSFIGGFLYAISTAQHLW